MSKRSYLVAYFAALLRVCTNAAAGRQCTCNRDQETAFATAASGRKRRSNQPYFPQALARNSSVGCIWVCKNCGSSWPAPRRMTKVDCPPARP